MTGAGVLRETAAQEVAGPGVRLLSSVDCGRAVHEGSVAACDAIPRETTSAVEVRAVQRAWASDGIALRLKAIGRARGLMAERAEEFADAMAPELNRSRADTLASEWLPLLAACRYLEREAVKVLRTRRPGRRGLPLWLAGVRAEVERVPFGTVLVIGPANYPLLLPGVQALQALAAGNAVIWKPGRGGERVARLFAAMMREAGLPAGLLRVTDESVAAAAAALSSGEVSKVFFTGSAAAGKAVLRSAAETATPCVVELSGSDAVIVLPGAELGHVAKAVGFGLRLNGSATCMAPRRLLVVGADAARRAELQALLERELAAMEPVRVAAAVLEEVRSLLAEARADGATVLGGKMDAERGAEFGTMRAAVVLGGRAEMRIARVDVFAPVITVIEVADERGVLRAQERCPLALTAAIFYRETGGHGEANYEQRAALRLARELAVGTVLLNDAIVPTADPRMPFGGRRGSGFGTTRGAEGLLEMTAARVISVRSVRSSTRHYEATGLTHLPLFAGLGAGLYGGRLAARWLGWRRMIAAGWVLGRMVKNPREGRVEISPFARKEKQERQGRNADPPLREG